MRSGGYGGEVGHRGSQVRAHVEELVLHPGSSLATPDSSSPKVMATPMAQLASSTSA